MRQRQRKHHLGEEQRNEIGKEREDGRQYAQQKYYNRLRSARCCLLLLLISVFLVLIFFSWFRGFLSYNYRNRFFSIFRFEFQHIWHEPHRDSSAKRDGLNKHKSDGIFVTFIIPTTLTRKTLHRTLQSLVNQTDQTSWNAIVGVDMTTIDHMPMRSGVSKEERIELAMQEYASGVNHDDRFHFCKVYTSSKFRGRKKNGSGLVRNEMIQKHANESEWVAFLDDDDTLSSYYVQFLKMHSAVNGQLPKVDMVIFRMQGFPYPEDLVPPLNHTSHVFKVGDIGISYAVRRRIFDFVDFVSHPSEDYLFVKKVLTHKFPPNLSFESNNTSSASWARTGASVETEEMNLALNGGNVLVGISTCVAYYVKQDPPISVSMPRCTLEPNADNPIVLL